MGNDSANMYLNYTAMLLQIQSGSSTLEVHKVNFPDAVVWNPWIDKSKSMGDFGDEEYKVRGITVTIKGQVQVLAIVCLKEITEAS